MVLFPGPTDGEGMLCSAHQQHLLRKLTKQERDCSTATWYYQARPPMPRSAAKKKSSLAAPGLPCKSNAPNTVAGMWPTLNSLMLQRKRHLRSLQRWLTPAVTWTLHPWAKPYDLVGSSWWHLHFWDHILVAEGHCKMAAQKREHPSKTVL